MCGWTYLPRYIDKIRLHLAGKLPPDYAENLGKGFDQRWLQAAGVTHEQMIQLVRDSITDGQVCDWVRTHVRKTEQEQAAHAQGLLNYPPADDEKAQARLNMRKQQSALSHRDDIRTFVDYIDVDEGRS